MRGLRRSIAPVAVLLFGLSAVPLLAQDRTPGRGPAGSPAPGATASVRITMDALHAAGGVPPGWRFGLPPGDPAVGRRLFADLKCYACHAVKGEQFPVKPGEPLLGPEFSGMGDHHAAEYFAEYFAESIVNPNAVLVEGPGWIGADGRSVMPAYRDLTVAQLIDLVAYLKSLKGSGAGHAHATPRIQVVGPYNIRVEFRTAGQAQGHTHGATGTSEGLLAVFVTLESSGQPLPYMNVMVRIQNEGQPVRVGRLTPIIGPEGFFYGAEVSLSPQTRQIAISVGPTGARVVPGAPEGLKQTMTATFPWP